MADNTHNVGALGLKGIGTTNVQVGHIVWLQETDEVETFRLGRERHPVNVVRAGAIGTQGQRTGPRSALGQGERGREDVSHETRPVGCTWDTGLPGSVPSTHLVTFPFLDTLGLFLSWCLP